MHGRRFTGGFTMIELMMVVAVAGILTTIAVVAYTKNLRKVRATEVVQIFAALKSKEELYRAEFGKYLPVCKSPSGDVWKDCSESDSQFWPEPLPGAGKQMLATSLPPRWAQLKPQIPTAGLYCQYLVVAGVAGDRTGMGDIGESLFGTDPPTRNWYYLVAQCDWDDNPSINARYWQRDDWSDLGKENEGR